MRRVVVPVDEPSHMSVTSPVPLQEIRAERLHGGEPLGIPDSRDREIVIHAAATGEIPARAGQVEGFGSAAAGLPGKPGREASTMCIHPPSASAIRSSAAWSWIGLRQMHIRK